MSAPSKTVEPSNCLNPSLTVLIRPNCLTCPTCSTVELSNCQLVELSNCRTVELSTRQFVELSNCSTVELSTVELSNPCIFLIRWSAGDSWSSAGAVTFGVGRSGSRWACRGWILRRLRNQAMSWRIVGRSGAASCWGDCNWRRLVSVAIAEFAAPALTSWRAEALAEVLPHRHPDASMARRWSACSCWWHSSTELVGIRLCGPSASPVRHRECTGQAICTGPAVYLAGNRTVVSLDDGGQASSA